MLVWFGFLVQAPLSPFARFVVQDTGPSTHRNPREDMLAVPRLDMKETIQFQPGAPLIIPGSHRALNMRGHPIKRHKFWAKPCVAQPCVDEGCRRYGYPGWQNAIALATKALGAFPFLEEIASRLNEGLQIPCNHWIGNRFWLRHSKLAAHGDHARQG